MNKMDLQEIKELLQQFDNSLLTEFRIKDEAFELYFAKSTGTTNVESLQTKSDPLVQDIEIESIKSDDLFEIKAPMVGTFYSSAEEDGNPFFKVGDYVEAGETICIIEAMKMMNEIPAPVSGKIVSIEAKNGELVDYNSLLMILDKEDVS